MDNRDNKMKTHLAKCKTVKHVKDERKDWVNGKQRVHMETYALYGNICYKHMEIFVEPKLCFCF